jgi:putative ABC transport system substrate-binding protein
VPDAYRQVGVYTARILKGARPGDLPVIEAAKIALVLDLKTAKAVGLSFPLPLLGRADDVRFTPDCVAEPGCFLRLGRI